LMLPYLLKNNPEIDMPVRTVIQESVWQ